MVNNASFNQSHLGQTKFIREFPSYPTLKKEHYTKKKKN